MLTPLFFTILAFTKRGDRRILLYRTRDSTALDLIQAMAGTLCRPRLRQLNETLLKPVLVL